MGTQIKRGRETHFFPCLGSTAAVPIQQQYFIKHERLIFHLLSYSSTQQNEKQAHPLHNCVKAVLIQSAESLQKHKPCTLSAWKSQGRGGKGREAGSLALLLSLGSDSGAGLAKGCKLYTSSGYILGMRGSSFVSFADSISWIIVLFSAFSSQLICLALWHFFHIFGMCLLLKQTQIWPEGEKESVCALTCPLHPEILWSFSLPHTCINVKERYVKEI